MRIVIFKTLFWISVILFLPLLATVDQCEGESYGRMGGFEISNLLIFSVFVLFLDFVVYLIDGIILLTKKVFKKTVNNSELKNFASLFLILLLWLLILRLNSNNGKCDVIIGPADTGLCLAMLLSVVVNYWKFQILKKARSEELT